MTDFYRYLEDEAVHVLDCAGKVNLELGLARLQTLGRRLSERTAANGCQRLLIDFRHTVWESEDVHMQLSAVTRRDFLNANNEGLRAAILNQRFKGSIAPNEHWFVEESEALAWLQQG